MDNSQETYQQIEGKVLYEARRHVNPFIEYVCRDEKDNSPIYQGDIHIVMQEFIDYCLDNGKTKIAIEAPFGHGKTIQVLGRALHLLGSNTNLRIKVVCNSDDNAAERVTFIKTYIEESEELRKVFPHLKQGDKAWGSRKLVVERETISKDATFSAHGVLSSGVGGRADFLFCDDVVDLRNSQLQPGLKKQVIEAYHSIWSSRLDGEEAITIVIGTMWTQDDLMMEILNDLTFCNLKISVNQKIDKLICEYRGV